MTQAALGPPSSFLTPSAGVSTLVTNTRSTHHPTPGGGDADGTTAGDLGLPRRLRRPTRLPADCAGDRRGRWACFPIDRARAPGQPRAGWAAQTRPDQAAGRRARWPRAPRGARRGARETAARRTDRRG